MPTRSPAWWAANLREHLESVRRNRSLNRLLTDVELPVGPHDLEVQPMDAQAVRDIFARLEFKTLIPRVAELAGIEQQMAAVTSAAAVPMPVAVQPGPADLLAWLDAAAGRCRRDTRPRGRPPSPRRLRDDGCRRRGRLDDRGLDRADRLARLRCAEGLHRCQAAGQGAPSRGAPPRRPDIRCAARRLAAPPELSRQVARRPRRALPR